VSFCLFPTLHPELPIFSPVFQLSPTSFLDAFPPSWLILPDCRFGFKFIVASQFVPLLSHRRCWGFPVFPPHPFFLSAQCCFGTLLISQLRCIVPLTFLHSFYLELGFRLFFLSFAELALAFSVRCFVEKCAFQPFSKNKSFPFGSVRPS